MRQSGMYGVAHLPALSPLGRATNHTVNAAVSNILRFVAVCIVPRPSASVDHHGAGIKGILLVIMKLYTSHSLFDLDCTLPNI